jgi:hypothetical protein
MPTMPTNYLNALRIKALQCWSDLPTIDQQKPTNLKNEDCLWCQAFLSVAQNRSENTGTLLGKAFSVKHLIDLTTKNASGSQGV